MNSCRGGARVVYDRRRTAEEVSFLLGVEKNVKESSASLGCRTNVLSAFNRPCRDCEKNVLCPFVIKMCRMHHRLLLPDCSSRGPISIQVGGTHVALYFRNLSFFVQCRTELEASKGRDLQGRLVQK